ncbi:hypothetical protein JCM11641_001736 [Rhodosporidiobolus odoratus]
MPFGSPLVPSPTLSRSPTSPIVSTNPRSTSPSFTSKLPSTITTSGLGGTVGLGVSGAGQLGVQDDQQGAKADVTSPLELTQFVDNLLNDLESRFDTLSQDVLSRLNSLSTRVDSLETSLSDLMSGADSGPLASSTTTGAGSSESDSPHVGSSP